MSWDAAAAKVEALARAMMAHGVKRGDVVAVIGENLPEAYLVQYAALCAGAAATHLYPDASATELGYVLKDSGAVLLFAEDQEQVDKFLQAGGAKAGVLGVVYLDGRGLWDYADPLLIDFERFLAGAPADADARAELDARIAAGGDDDLAALCYTSGTTGSPKGVRLTHRHLLDNAYRLIASFGIPAHIDYFSYISPAWAAEQFTGVALSLLAPAVVHFAEKPETVATDMREISPQFLLFTPRQWEMIASQIEAQMLDAKPMRRRLYEWAIAAPARLRWLADALVLRAIRDNIGLTRAKFPISAGSGLSAEIFRRFHALGIPLRNLYGSTEAGLVSAHWGAEAEPSTLGRPLLIARSVGAPLELKIAADGELLVRGGAGFGGYHRNEQATSNVLDADGWFHTGDAMHMPESGELVFLDRVKDMRRLCTGSTFPPQTIENHLRASPFLRDAIVLGDETRGFIAALVNVDAGIFGRYLESRNIGWGSRCTQVVLRAHDAERTRHPAGPVGRVGLVQPVPAASHVVDHVRSRPVQDRIPGVTHAGLAHGALVAAPDRHPGSHAALLAPDADRRDHLARGKPPAHRAGDHRALELGRAEPRRGCAPGQYQLHALQVRVPLHVGLPSRKPAVHHVAGLPAHDDEVRHRAAPPVFRTPSATDATRPGPGRCGPAGGDRHDLGCRGGRTAGRPGPASPSRR